MRVVELSIALKIVGIALLPFDFHRLKILQDLHNNRVFKLLAVDQRPVCVGICGEEDSSGMPIRLYIAKFMFQSILVLCSDNRWRHWLTVRVTHFGRDAGL